MRRLAATFISLAMLFAGPASSQELTVDGEQAVECSGLEHVEKRRPVDLARAGDDLGAPLTRRGRARGVLDVTRTHMRHEVLQRRDRIALVVKNHVGGIEIDKQVFSVDIVNEFQQMVSGFLARL